MELSGMVFMVDIFSAVFLGTSWRLLWCNIASLLNSVDDALGFLNMRYFTSNLRSFRRTIVGLFHLGVF